MGHNAEILYRSTPQTDVRPSTVGRKKFLLPTDAPDHFAAYGFDVDFDCVLDGVFPPAPKNTQSNNPVFNPASGYAANVANAILTDFTQPSDQGAGLGRFTGTFHIVPASWDQFVNQQVTFPGIRDNDYIGGVRDPQSRIVLTRQRREYFVVDPATLAAGVLDSGGTAIVRVGSKGAIPSLYRQPFGFTIDGGATMLTTGEITGLVKAGGITGWYETVPNTGRYQSWCAVVVAFNAALAGGGTQAWDATHPPAWDGLVAPAATIGQWRFTDSRVEDYAGNIFCRVSEYVLAQ